MSHLILLVPQVIYSCTFSCDPDYSLHGSTTSQCVSGEWTASPDTVIIISVVRVLVSLQTYLLHFSTGPFYSTATPSESVHIIESFTWKLCLQPQLCAHVATAV